jgi:hypothetical protein
MGIRNRRFRGKVVYSGGIVNQRTVFQDAIDQGDPNAAAPAGGEGGGGAGGLQWDPDVNQYVARANTRVWLNNGQTAKWGASDGVMDIYLGNAIGAESITYSATGLPSGLSINSSTGQLTGSANPVGYNQVTVTASDGSSSITKTIYVVQRSQQLYDSPGTYSITLPNYIDKIHVVAVGGGGAGSWGPATPAYTNSGGAGGGLRWIQELPVTGGETLNVYVGSGGVGTVRPAPNPGTYYYGTAGGDSKITRGAPGSETTLLIAEGGDGSPPSRWPFAVGMIQGGGGTPVGNKPDGSVVGGGYGGHTRLGAGTGGSGGGGGGYLGPGGPGRTATAMPNTYPWPAWPTSLQPIFGNIKDVFSWAPTDQRAGDSPGGGGTGGSPNGTSLTPGGGGVGLYGYTGKGGKFPSNTVSYYPGLTSPLSVPAAVYDNGGDPYDLNPAYAPRRNDPQTFAYGGSGGFNVRTRPGPVWAPFGFPPATWSHPSYFQWNGQGANFGGGGGGCRPATPIDFSVSGGNGGVRIIWGDDREWIGAKNTEDL